MSPRLFLSRARLPLPASFSETAAGRQMGKRSGPERAPPGAGEGRLPPKDAPWGSGGCGWGARGCCSRWARPRSHQCLPPVKPRCFSWRARQPGAPLGTYFASFPEPGSCACALSSPRLFFGEQRGAGQRGRGGGGRNRASSQTLAFRGRQESCWKLSRSPPQTRAPRVHTVPATGLARRVLGTKS